ncbi:hypothetical protein TWF481_002881 [Arthrobotrys musiformis]|uniref:Uncharacterized protein n=1 Tax=Arthrobotrys musiformis TaxID=47236 RepID=A0AAV9VTG3_9PEZI
MRNVPLSSRLVSNCFVEPGLISWTSVPILCIEELEVANDRAGNKERTAFVEVDVELPRRARSDFSNLSPILCIKELDVAKGRIEVTTIAFLILVSR